MKNLFSFKFTKVAGILVSCVLGMGTMSTANAATDWSSFFNAFSAGNTTVNQDAGQDLDNLADAVGTAEVLATQADVDAALLVDPLSTLAVGDTLAAATGLHADVDANQTASESADIALQSDIDQNELDSDNADIALQSDIDQNELDSDNADIALQSDIDQNELDSDNADIALQSDIDQNELDSDNADIALQSDIDQNELDSDNADIALQSDN